MENMKKKKLCVILFVVLVSAFLYANSYIVKEDASDLVKENIEALAMEESDSDVMCEGTGCVDCPISDERVKYVMSGYSLRY